MKIPESSAICQGTIMEDGLLSLKWNNHKITFCEILRTLREKSNYTDATIAVEGKFYPVHKLVLSTCSEYFEDIFARTPCKSPVIVLKDVRSQDMDALLDYMYLGEVNVNQNDLASLLKTAECLRIRGLAVPDEENTKSRKAPSDERHDSPPPKRRRHDETSRPVSPPPSANTKTPTPLPSPVQPSSAICSQSSPDHLDSDPPPHIVKVEMQEHDHEDGFRQDSYEGSVNEEGGGDFGADVSKAEHDPESYGSSSFPGPSLQPGGDLAWEEGDSSSFPPETFSSDVPAGQQPQGGHGWYGRSPAVALSHAMPLGGGGGGIGNSLLGNRIEGAPRYLTSAGLDVRYPLLSTTTTTTTTSSSSSSSSSLTWTKKSSNSVCPICLKDFLYPSAMALHMRTHTGWCGRLQEQHVPWAGGTRYVLPVHEPRNTGRRSLHRQCIHGRSSRASSPFPNT
ncbi:protein tramtrack, alpha isoform-like isoform X10 [Macrobrachium rosenbergii]|uniref:protein tramtrack, alpha isoform-like isoform X10 n=1 Tax=Macrobrachium rosenbergii TaxID=79674 RepID=UPI0034D53239